mmetsp:Transcript_19481/g.52197  ORF Transcript_19481/g.52197 Transcript_19481/m.52197 type:complete len:303 (+) Transcript_19481:67-975(+)
MHPSSKSTPLQQRSRAIRHPRGRVRHGDRKGGIPCATRGTPAQPYKQKFGFAGTANTKAGCNARPAALYKNVCFVQKLLSNHKSHSWPAGTRLFCAEWRPSTQGISRFIVRGSRGKASQIRAAQGAIAISQEPLADARPVVHVAATQLCEVVHVVQCLEANAASRLLPWSPPGILSFARRFGSALSTKAEVGQELCFDTTIGLPRVFRFVFEIRPDKFTLTAQTKVAKNLVCLCAAIADHCHVPLALEPQDPMQLVLLELELHALVQRDRVTTVLGPPLSHNSSRGTACRPPLQFTRAAHIV